MARISKVEKEKNKERLDSIILELFLQEGHSGIIYERVSVLSSMKISTLQGYYPSRDCFLHAIEGRVMPIFLDYLQFDNGREKFVSSWMLALQDNIFCNILKMLFSHIAEEQQSIMTVNTVNAFRSLVGFELGIDVLNDIYMLIGRSLIYILVKDSVLESV